MTGLRVAAIASLLVGAAIVIAGLATPTCANYAGTARDSGYPCTIEHSNGVVDFVLGRSTTISIPLAPWVGIALIVVGGVILGRSYAKGRGPR